MPGFGSGSAGDAPFGQFDWARRVLYESAPDIYRRLDTDGLFQRYAAAQAGSFNNLRERIAAFAELRDPRAVRTQYDDVNIFRLGRVEPFRGDVLQQGVLATVSALGVFTATRARFTAQDIGRELTLSGSSTQSNNTSVVITDVLSPTEAVTNPALSPDTGPLKWALRELETSETQVLCVQVFAGNVLNIAPGWFLSDGYADFTVLGRKQFKLETDSQFLTLREGSDGSINSSLRLSSPTLNASSRDVGRQVVIGAAVNPDNNGHFEVVDVLSSTEVVLDSLELVPETTGALFWAFYKNAEVYLEGSATLRGAVEQLGEDGEVVVPGGSTFRALSAAFTADEVGKLLTLHKPSSGNNGTYEIVGVSSSHVVTLDTSLTPESGMHWELRAPTGKGDETQVEVRAPSLIKYLAYDFGVVIDQREEEEWQRRWVTSVPRWIDMKGHEDAYRFIAQLTGFEATAKGLYRVSQEIYEAAVSAGAETYDPGEADVGRSGDDGSLELVSGRVEFSSPTATFENWDVGRHIDLSGTAGVLNDGLRTIAEVVNANTVAFRLSDTMTGSADANNGALDWRVVRLYSDQAPLIPVYDEINSDLMTYLKGSTVFVVDKYCWELAPAAWSTLLGPGDTGDGVIFVDAVSPAISAVTPITYVVTGRGDWEVIAGLGVGLWRFTDSASANHFVETVPTLHRDHYGVDGALTLSFFLDRRFVSASATFTVADVGKFLRVRDAAEPTNNKAWLITALVGTTELELSATQALVVDGNNGAISWEVIAPETFGVDGFLTAPRRFTSLSATFTSADVGKRLIVTESGSNNNRTFVIAAFVDANNVDLAAYDAPTTPDANNGALIWGMFSYEFEVVATTPPALGAASLEYLCSEQAGCDYCRSNKIYIQASTPYALERGFERLRNRFEKAKPKHVEIIENYGVELTASLQLTATVDSP